MTKFILVDNKTELAEAWESQFSEHTNFEIHGGVDIFDFSADAIVSPANSFGMMDGGIDLVYSNKMGWGVQERVQEKIKEEYDGELLIGQALMVNTNYDKIPILISAPTMRIPLILRYTPNVYLASKAIFLLAKRNPDIKSIICPGLGTGCGEVTAEDCAIRMRMAYEDWYLGQETFPPNLLSIKIKHYEETTK